MDKRANIKRRPRPGRPEAHIDWPVLDDMLIKGESAQLIADYFNINVDVLYKKVLIEKKVNYSEYSRSKKTKGLRMIRSKTFMKAMGNPDDPLSGDNVCLMHLNRHMRREWDKPPEEENVTPNEEFIRQAHENMDLKAQLAELRELLEKVQGKIDANESQTGQELS